MCHVLHDGLHECICMYVCVCVSVCVCLCVTLLHFALDNPDSFALVALESIPVSSVVSVPHRGVMCHMMH